MLVLKYAHLPALKCGVCGKATKALFWKAAAHLAASTPGICESEDPSQPMIGAGMSRPPTALVGADGSLPSTDELQAVFSSGRAFGAPNEADSHASVGVAEIGLEAFDPETWTTVCDQEADSSNGEALREAKALATQWREAQQARLAQPNAASFRFHDAGRATSESAAFDQDEDLEGPQPSHDNKVERGMTGMNLGGTIKPPAVMARGWPVNHVSCWQCQVRPGWKLQNVVDVYNTARRCSQSLDTTPEAREREGVDAVVAMAASLEEGEENEVVARTACCPNIDCMLRASLQTPEYRATWLAGQRRPQDERETERALTKSSLS